MSAPYARPDVPANAIAFFETVALPVHSNVLWPTHQEARKALCAPIRLVASIRDGTVYNELFEGALAACKHDHENSHHYSQRFKSYAQELAKYLVDRFSVQGNTIIEIGCGRGEFLDIICGVADARGIGFDEHGEDDRPHDARVLVNKRQFSATNAHLAADLIICRHVLERVANPQALLDEIVRVAARRPGTGIFIEVANFDSTLRQLGIWDVTYEQRSYFTAHTLERVCAEAGIKVNSVFTTYGGQYLCLEGQLPSGPRRVSRTSLVSDPNRGWWSAVHAFGAHHRKKVAMWKRRLVDWQGAGDTVALWGAGSKGVTFLNTVPRAASIQYVVDINPRKQGRFTPGTGHQILVPQTLAAHQPDTVLIMNPVYQNEIRNAISEMGFEPRLLVV